MKKINVGMLGIGNIGTGTYRALEQNKETVESRTGLSIEIVKILNRHPEKDRGIDIPKEKYTADVSEILDDPSIDIIVELIGGIEPATEYMLRAMKNGKHVVTANKAAIAANGEELSRTAMENHVLFRFEASVAGGIPIINSITQALTVNQFDEVTGILNGTTNYILTAMTEFGRDYKDVLKDAQAKGFAEADPTADVEGLDAGNKLSILTSLVFGMKVLPEEIPTNGISSITKEDIGFAKDFGYKIKLLGSAKQDGKEIACSVEPALVPNDHPLASVENEFNAVFLTGNAVDKLMFYGRGAGPLPTGSAVMGDVIEVSRSIAKGAAFDEVPLLRYDADLTFIGEGTSSYYIRLDASDIPGVLSAVADSFAEQGISIKTVLQRANSDSSQDAVPLIFIVHKTDRNMLNLALESIKKISAVREIKNVLRVLDEEA
ncbi:MAG: homoserine dehydrogenase [Eubacteriales bacterium]|nr:homoserine dehydrogenase [Eubacteriales bacterium]